MRLAVFAALRRAREVAIPAIHLSSHTHPGPLPQFGGQGMYGMNVHKAVLEAGVKESGPTVFVVADRKLLVEVVSELAAGQPRIAGLSRPVDSSSN